MLRHGNTIVHPWRWAKQFVKMALGGVSSEEKDVTSWRGKKRY
jgi:hypothetical protein